VHGGELLEVSDVHLRLGAVRALDGVSFRISSGTVHGLIGHNGSGKSTTVKVLAGLLTPDGGSVAVTSDPAVPDAPRRRPHVVTVFQDLGLAEDLTVFENVLVNSFERRPLGHVHVRREQDRVRELFALLRLDVPLGVRVSGLPEAERVMLCVARALLHAGVKLTQGTIDADAGLKVDLLVLDEPTSSLPRTELRRFRALVRSLTESVGVATLLVTHNPADIATVCDDFTALRNGRVICSAPAEGFHMDRLIELMAGKGVQADGRIDTGGSRSPSAPVRNTDAVFVAEDLMTPGLDGPVTLIAHKGELLGMTGLEGSGFREFLQSAMGVRDRVSGTVRIDGRIVEGGPAGVCRANAMYISADRTRTSGIPSATLYENMTLGRVGVFCRRGFLRRRAEMVAVRRMLEKLDVHPPEPKRLLSEMSGGQQQKVVVGRALMSESKLFVFEEPIAAVDVGASQDILSYLAEATKAGVGVIAASGDFGWMPSVCDRVVVFRSGRIAGELVGGDITEDRVLLLAYG
jgi:ribose transport system ATP-binding protein